jgi:hypothetical protein
MRPRFKKSLDANHNDVKGHLEENGCEVIDCSAIGGIVDLLVYYPPKSLTTFLEVKIPGCRAAFTKPQLRWISGTRWPVRIVTDKHEALEFATTLKGQLSEGHKHRLRVLADTTKAEQVRPDAVEKVLAI